MLAALKTTTGRIALAGLPLLGLTASAEASEPIRSPRNANYTIEVSLDPASRTLDGRQVLTWRNTQSQPTNELWFHLYWNAWRNDRSTWMVEDRIRGRSSNRGPRSARRTASWK